VLGAVQFTVSVLELTLEKVGVPGTSGSVRTVEVALQVVPPPFTAQIS
jgi:hypothetical protein